MITLRTAAAVSVLASAALLQGCATNIKASATENPPPAAAFNTYGRIELRPVMFKDGTSGNGAALAKIEENLKKDMAEPLAKWNARASNGRTLIIQPVVDELSFKSGAKRVFLGPLAGSSGVLMHVEIKDNAGRVIANPQFFQRTAAMSGGFTLGVHDNLMLTRVANLASGYLTANYERAVGGPTGADDKGVAK